MNNENINNNEYPFSICFNEDSKEEYYVSGLFLLGTSRVETNKSSIYLKHTESIEDTKEEGMIIKHPSYRCLPNVDRIGTMLVRFLNADFSSFEKSYDTFFYAYTFDILNAYVGVNETKTRFESLDEFKVYYTKFFNQSKTYLKEIQASFREAVEVIYNLNEKSEYEQYSAKTKLIGLLIKHQTGIYSHTKNLNLQYEEYGAKYQEFKGVAFDELLEKIENNEILKIRTIYSSEYLGEICYSSLNTLVNMENIVIKKCKRCNRFFIPNVRNDEIYCDNENIDGSTICRDIGAKETYKKNLENVPALLEYRRTYQKKLMYSSRNKEDKQIKKEFDTWKKEAQAKIKEYKNGNMEQEELLEWMKENK